MKWPNWRGRLILRRRTIFNFIVMSKLAFLHQHLACSGLKPLFRSVGGPETRWFHNSLNEMTQLRQMADGHVERPNPSFGGKKNNFEGAVGVWNLKKANESDRRDKKKLLAKMALIKVGENQKIAGHTKFYQNRSSATPLNSWPNV